MITNNRQFIIYGLKRHKEIIGNIISDVNTACDAYDIRLILTEAIVNAFEHGNENDEEKPITIKYSCEGKLFRFEVTDAGKGMSLKNNLHQASEHNILSETGRGLFIINCIADSVDYKNNTLTVVKKLKFNK